MCVSYYNILKFTREARQRVNRHKDSRVKTDQGTQINQGNDLYERNRKRYRMTREEMKITNTLLIVVACFMACWAPFAITMFFDVYYPRPLPRAIDIGTLLLGYANSMCNPVVYGIRTQAFRRELNSLFSFCLENSRVTVSNGFQVSSAVVYEGDTLEAPEILDVSRIWRKQDQPMELKN